MEWHYIDENEKRVGPISSEEMASQISSEVVVEETKVWHKGFDQWRQARQTILASDPGFPGKPKPEVAGIIYPASPPKSQHLGLLGLLGAGIPQVIFGKLWMGISFFAVANILMFFLMFTARADDAIIYFDKGLWNFVSKLAFGLAVASVIDGYMTGVKLSRGETVNKWRIFP